MIQQINQANRLGILAVPAKVIEKNQDLMLLVGVIGVEATDTNPRVEKALRVAYAQIAQVVEALLARGVEEGATDPGLDLPCAAELFLGAAKPRLAVAVHCGAQSTADTVRLAAHAAEAGADGVAVIAPPYYRLDDEALAAHLEAAAQACAPTPFYLYEFERVSGYAVPLEVVAHLRDRVPNLVGMKVSDRPFERVRPYLLDGLDVFIGAESLLGEGLEAGVAGAVSGLAAAFPELVAEVVRAPSAAGVARLAGIRTAIERFPVQAALKVVAGSRGVPIRPDVRAPLRTLRADELAELERWLESSSPAPAR